MDYEGFIELELFPKPDNHKGDVYVLSVSNGTISKEFYVGQSSRFLGRMDDYFWAVEQAATDFKVGVAVRYFCQHPGLKVFVKHKSVTDPLKKEKAIIDELKKKIALLNDDRQLTYNYRDSNPANLEKVRDAIHKKCDDIIASLNT